MSKKIVYIDKNALKELNAFNRNIQTGFYDFFEILKQEGKLIYPFAKKLNKSLFEVRISDKGQFRALYTYQSQNIIILSVFQKKTQKTPTKEIKRALKRLKLYEK